MKHGRLQAKDLPDTPILRRLLAINRTLSLNGCLFNGFDNTVIPDVPFRLARAKMDSLVRRGYVSGCTCGCRGDFTITDLGIQAAHRTP
jgi:hypothetical protein